MAKFLHDSQDYNDVQAYFITYHTYGTWLHGDERGSVDRKHNVPETPLISVDTQRKESAQHRMSHEAVRLSTRQRAIVESAIQEVTERRGWNMHAINVRTNHVHVVVTANASPEKVMNDFKSWSTRRMVEAGEFENGKKGWVRHGSTRYLWDEKAVDDACCYVLEGQGIDLRGAKPSRS